MLVPVLLIWMRCATFSALAGTQMSLTSPEIRGARVFEEPLVPVGARASAGENEALSRALAAYRQSGAGEDVSAIARFLEEHPRSVWRASLLMNLGLVHRRTGYFSKALADLDEAWQLAKGETDLQAHAIADRSAGELADLAARLGLDQRLESVLEELKGRDVRGPATERIAAAREALWRMRHQPEDSFRCGPSALSHLTRAKGASNEIGRNILETHTSPEGMSLMQLGELAGELKMKYRLARREPGARIPVPAIVHWKVGHYGALVAENEGRYLLKDSTLSARAGGEGWVGRGALDSEASGYFLIRQGPLPPGWNPVSAREARSIRGRGYTNGPNPDGNGPNDPKGGGGGCGPGDRMASYSVHLMLVSLYIEDAPVGYTPPRGPDVQFKVSYSQREANQPGIFGYSNLGQKWTFDWLSYVIDDPQNPSRDARVYNRGGGTETHSGFDAITQTYASQVMNGAVLRRTSPGGYERRLADGSLEIFDRSDGATSFPRKIFMTRIADRAGNSLALTYDASLKLVSATDALGQATTISYELAADPLKITRVTDPFGRFATFEYNPDLQLSRITDVAGIVSAFNYDAGDFVRTLTTPYGTTTFAKGEQDTTRFLQATDPLGDTERVEFRQRAPGISPNEPPEAVPPPTVIPTYNQYLDGRNTFYWDKKAWHDFPADYTKALLFHWLHDVDTGLTSRVLESTKRPFENRVWYYYPGQSRPGFLDAATLAKPSKIARVLDDGTTQLYQFEYNRRGNVTRSIDPTGREISSDYSFNGIDLLEVAQTRTASPELLVSFTYNAQHLPLSGTDASGQTTNLHYNSFGQVQTVTNAKGETTTFTYDDSGYLIAIDRPTAGATTRFSYDGFGRVQTATDSEGYALAFDYDALDRLTLVTYPDGTFRQTIYDRLDPVQSIDRLGRLTIRSFNAVRQLVSSEDPLHRITGYEWCRCGGLERIIDPAGHPTTWNRDVGGRITSKVFADGSEIGITYETTTSRVREIVDAEGQSRQYTYYADNNLRQITFLGGPVSTPPVSFTYGPDYSRVLTMDDGTGRTTYRYNPITKSSTLGAARLASEAGPLPNSTITYEYDELGRTIARAINGVAQNTSFDLLGRVVQVDNPLGSFVFGYLNTTDRLSSIDYPNGQRTTLIYYDNLHDQRLAEIQHLDPVSAVLSKLDYAYDAEGRIRQWTRQADGLPVTYQLDYDDADQLLAATPQDVGSSRFAYTYDLAGNRTSEQIDDDVSTASYNLVNQIIGRQASSLPDPDPVVRRSEVTRDGLGRPVRIVERENDVVVSDKRFVFCGRELCEERDSTGATVVKRFYPEGVQIGVDNYFYTRDHLSSVRELTDVQGAVRARYDYDPYGRRAKIGGDLEADFGFGGLYFHAATGLQLASYRSYDANLARWISRDPIDELGGLNLYAYVDNNPVNYIDPTGLVPNANCPVCKPPDPKPLPRLCAKPPLPRLADPTGDPSGPGSGSGSGPGSGPGSKPEPDPAGGPVGKDRATPDVPASPLNGQQPGPDLSIHISGNTESGVNGVGGNIGSWSGDTSSIDLGKIADKVSDAVTYLRSR